MATSIQSLPPEIIATILSFLEGYEIAKVSPTCKQFYESSKIDTVWQIRCEQEYNVNEYNEEVYQSFFQLYSKVLHRYGFLLGYWQPDIIHYGGLIHCQMTKDGCLEARSYYGAGTLADNLYSYTLCRMSLDKSETGETRVNLRCGQETEHTCEVEKVPVHEVEKEGPDGDGGSLSSSVSMLAGCMSGCSGTSDTSGEGSLDKSACLVKFTCQGHESHDADHMNLHAVIKNAMPDDEFDEGILTMKIAYISKQFRHPILWHPLSLPKSQPGAPIQPGLFTGTYSAHGIEILLLRYPQGKLDTIEVYKVSGDPNVPAAKNSLVIDLQRPMVLSLEQQTTLHDLDDIDTHDLPPDWTMATLPRQPFQLPMGVWGRSETNHTYCTARFHSKGLVADHNHKSPKQIPGQFMVFDEDTFGHIWFELESFSLYKRINLF